MPIAMHHEDDNTYRLDISGVLSRSEFRQCEAELTSELDRGGSAKLLCVLTAFEGWERHADWNDLAFYVKYGDAIRANRDRRRPTMAGPDDDVCQRGPSEGAGGISFPAWRGARARLAVQRLNAALLNSRRQMAFRPSSVLDGHHEPLAARGFTTNPEALRRISSAASSALASSVNTMILASNRGLPAAQWPRCHSTRALRCR
jgi:hypothetical protein